MIRVTGRNDKKNDENTLRNLSISLSLSLSLPCYVPVPVAVTVSVSVDVDVDGTTNRCRRTKSREK